MTINSTTNRVAYTGNGTANPLAVSFPFFTTADLVVVETLIATGAQTAKALTTDYTVTGTPDANGNYSSGGAVVPNSAVANTKTWTIYRDPALTQLVQHVDNDPLPAASIDTPLDRLTAIAQRTREIALRSIRQPEGEATLDMTIPALVDRKGAILGFDATTGKPSVGVVPTLTSLQAQATAAAASAAAAAVSRAACDADVLTFANASKYKTVNNIFDLINDAGIIAQIQGRTFSGPYLDTYWAAMNAAGGTWFLPAGDYHLNAKQTMAAGVELWGAGNNSASGTVIFLGGDGTWAMEQINPLGVSTYEAFKLKDIFFQLTDGGIRWNDTSAGIDDTSGTMGYMQHVMVERCTFANDSGSHFYGVNLNKCFNGSISNCTFTANSVGIYLRGCDLNEVRNNRFNSQSDGCILDTSVGTFGSTNDIHHNDMNNPKNYFYRGSNRNGLIHRNHMELDASPGSTGTGGNMEAAIDILDGNGFRTTIHDNDVSLDVFADRWLRFRSSTIYTLDVRNNATPSSVLPRADLGNVAYFTNSGNRVMVRHEGNQGSDIYFPMNTKVGYGDPSAGFYAAMLGASYPGVAYGTGIGWDQSHQPSIYLKCNSGDFILPADATTSHYIEFSDWSGFPANNLIGTFSVDLNTAAAVAGQVMNWQLLDGAGVISSGTITHTNANQMYINTICTAQAFTTKFVLRVWNQDTTRNNVVYFHAGQVRL